VSDVFEIAEDVIDGVFEYLMRGLLEGHSIQVFFSWGSSGGARRSRGPQADSPPPPSDFLITNSQG